jgi:hypothetical protein
MRDYHSYLLTCRVIVTATIGSTVRPGPTKITLTLVIWRFAAISVDASLIAGFGAVLLAIAIEATLTLTTKTAMSVGAERIGMTIMQTKITLVYVWALCICPT